MNRTDRYLSRAGAYLRIPFERLVNRCMEEEPVERALALFQDVARSVPAYRAFLAEHGVDPSTVKSPAEFASLPPVTKKGYALKYPLPELCRDGQLEALDMVAVSSGSTGEPCFWPRSAVDELLIAARFEQVFVDSFDVRERRTLAVVCFALGTWVGGMFTASCCRILSAKGYPVTVVTPGSNPREILRVVSRLGPSFDQVVLLGYPPFLKGVVDQGRAAGVAWGRHGLKLVLAGEVFSEEWRTLVAERAGAGDVLRFAAALYGTADAGVLGNETPLSVAIRRFLAGAPEVARELFEESRLPTLLQYDPTSRYFECEGKRLLFTGDNGVPLVRYDILDTGGVMPFADMLVFVEGRGFVPPPGLPVRELPFVWVFGRSDFTVSYFGANVYPENVSVALEQPGIREWATGKFVLEAREDPDRNLFLAVDVELAPGEAPGDGRAEAAATEIRRQLLRLSSEYGAYVPPERQTPVVSLASHGDPDRFPAGVKHRYTRKPAA